MNANEETNKQKEIKAKVSIEITEDDEPSIGERIYKFIAAVCLLSLLVCIVSTVFVTLAPDHEHPGETLSRVQGVSALVCVASFWLAVAYKLIWEDSGSSSGQSKYL